MQPMAPSPWLPEFDPTDTVAGRAFVERLTTDAAALQRELLTEILKRNAHTEYLRPFLLLPDGGLPPDGDLREAFKKLVPVSGYDDIKPYVHRIASGREPSTNLLCSEPITHLLRSSCTSGGKQKIFPSTAEELDRKLFFYGVQSLVRNMHLHADQEGKRGMGMRLTLTFPVEHTPSGLHVQAATTAYYRSSQFRDQEVGGFDRCTSPMEAILWPDAEQSMYCQLLCGLLHRDSVDHVGTSFANSLVRAIKFLEHNWEEMCSDIRTGSLSGRITHAPLRDAVIQRYLRGPNPALADEVASECAAKPWDGIVARLWPRARCALTIVTGSMAQYIPILRSYCGGRLPIVSPCYASTECAAGVNLRPLDPPSRASYALLPNIAYFEFAEIQPRDEETPTVDDNGNPGEMKFVDLVDVEIGRSYELVVTTFAGLYRYRVGDLLTVTGFYNATPLFLFSGRHDVILSIDHEKISEEELLRAISQAIELHLGPLGYMLSGSTAFADISKLPGHYVLFWELTNARSNGVVGDIPDQTVMENCCSTVEECFDQMYCKIRQRANITALEIRVLEQGAYDALMDFFVSRGASAGQYKTPTAIRSKEAMMVLEERVVARFFSKEIPRGSLYDDYMKK
ncbi:probable indole-3-acetic acid-amido synthetase GH3.7 isoform X2 [Triticum dicoccoides]|uniref:probable indole-3-acetic acid-amido synthetase GH3.7 isoform X2 n=1 Tax=Triticum dicoccoides TaxID=85692 RepID=UPI001891AD61|nr:probable indole-3-acetic acid-amido synthetase GH3.7 isoform X2 [Triticum dicoccoides]